MLCLHNYNVTLSNFTIFLVDLNFFGIINRIFLIKLIAWKYVCWENVSFFFLTAENQTIFQGIWNSVGLFAFACQTPSALANSCN